jgi:type II secretory pathway pseudopilin PulG
MHKRKTKRAITLLEIMIVILLIGLVGSVIGYNMKGSLDEGRAFKSEQGATRVREILLLEVAKGADINEVVGNPSKYLSSSGFIKDVQKTLQDGWGVTYEIKVDDEDIVVSSSKLQKFQKDKADKLQAK